MNSALADSLGGDMAETAQWWESGGIYTLARLAVIGLVLMVALLVIVRPALSALLQRHALHVQELDTSKKLTAPDSDTDNENQDDVHSLTQKNEDALPSDVVRLSQKQHQLDTDYPTDIGAHVKTVKDLVADDPLRAVQVIKHWVSSDA